MLGFKVFNKDFTNQYGMKFEIGREYTASDASIGLQGKGLHFCDTPKETLRYTEKERNQLLSFDDFILCEIEALGKIKMQYDDYYGYTSYATDKIAILRQLSREELMSTVLASKDQIRIEKLIIYLALTEAEINDILTDPQFQYGTLRSSIRYHQLGEKDAFNRR